MIKAGDKVRATGNYEDEQLGEFAPHCIQTVLETRDTSHMKGTSGLWIKTDVEPDWVDAGWFEVVESMEERNEATECNWGGKVGHQKG